MAAQETPNDQLAATPGSMIRESLESIARTGWNETTGRWEKRGDKTAVTLDEDNQYAGNDTHLDRK